MCELPSPEDLKGKIVIKDRKVGGEEASSTSDALEEDDEDSAYESFQDGLIHSRAHSLSNVSFQNIQTENYVERVGSSSISNGQAATSSTKDVVADENIFHDQLKTDGSDGTEAVYFKFVEEGTRVPIRLMSLDNNRHLISNRKIKKRIDEEFPAILKENYLDDNGSEFLSESPVESPLSSTSLNNYYRSNRCSIKMRHRSSVRNGERDREESEKKNSVISLGPSDRVMTNF